VECRHLPVRSHFKNCAPRPLTTEGGRTIEVSVDGLNYPRRWGVTVKTIKWCAKPVEYRQKSLRSDLEHRTAVVGSAHPGRFIQIPVTRLNGARVGMCTVGTFESVENCQRAVRG